MWSSLLFLNILGHFLIKWWSSSSAIVEEIGIHEIIIQAQWGLNITTVKALQVQVKASTMPKIKLTQT